MANVPSLKLNSGHEMPSVGFGLWKVNNDTCADQVYNAIKTGYRCFDGACGAYSMLLTAGVNPQIYPCFTDTISYVQTTVTKSKPAAVSLAQSMKES